MQENLFIYKIWLKTMSGINKNYGTIFLRILKDMFILP